MSIDHNENEDIQEELKSRVSVDQIVANSSSVKEEVKEPEKADDIGGVFLGFISLFLYFGSFALAYFTDFVSVYVLSFFAIPLSIYGVIKYPHNSFCKIVMAVILFFATTFILQILLIIRVCSEGCI